MNAIRLGPADGFGWQLAFQGVLKLRQGQMHLWRELDGDEEAEREGWHVASLACDFNSWAGPSRVTTRWFKTSRPKITPSAGQCNISYSHCRDCVRANLHSNQIGSA